MFFIETIKTFNALMILLIKWETHEGMSTWQAKENALSNVNGLHTGLISQHIIMVFHAPKTR